MMNTVKVSKSQENMIQCALMAVEFYKQATSPQMSLFQKKDAPENEKQEEEMARKQPVKLPAVSLEEIRTTAKDALDAQAKEIIYKTLGADLYTAWFHNRGFVCFFSKGTPSFEAENGFITQQIAQRFWPQCVDVLKKEMGV